jgi:hypothetical protein
MSSGSQMMWELVGGGGWGGVTVEGWRGYILVPWQHRLNMELDLRSLFGLHVHSCTHWMIPRPATPPPSPTFGLIFEVAIGQPR